MRLVAHVFHFLNTIWTFWTHVRVIAYSLLWEHKKYQRNHQDLKNEFLMWSVSMNKIYMRLMLTISFSTCWVKEQLFVVYALILSRFASASRQRMSEKVGGHSISCQIFTFRKMTSRSASVSDSCTDCKDVLCRHTECLIFVHGALYAATSYAVTILVSSVTTVRSKHRREIVSRIFC